MSTLTPPTFAHIKAAHQVIQPFAHRTPVLSSSQFNSRVGADVYFKCENFQKVGAFKFRGACNAIMTLPDDLAQKGVTTHSSGNHAQAVAVSAKLRGIKAHIVMPENAPKVKIEAVRSYGAEITFCAPTQEARQSTMEEVVAETGANVVHPFNDSRVIAGQATVSIEFLESNPDLDFILTPVGGGGLLSGTALAVSHVSPSTKVIGTEPELADDAYHSFKSGELKQIYGTNTIADGLRTIVGDLPFSIIKEHVEDIVTVGESSIVSAMRFIWERMNIIIEPSSAVPVAALLDGKVDVSGKKVGVILTGGNVDLGNLPW